MTDKQKSYKKSLIQQVHISPKYKEYYRENREDYLDKLLEHFGVKSSTEMSIKQLVALVKWLNYELPDLPIIRDRSRDATAAQLGLMRELWQHYARDTSEEALRGFVKRITKKLYLHLESVSKADATKCIIALKASTRNKEKKENG